MGQVPKAIQIHDAFNALFRSAYLVEFKEHADHVTVDDAFFRTVVPVLDKAESAAIESLSPGRMAMFVKTGVYQAISDFKEILEKQKAVEQAEDDELEALEMAEAAEETW